MSEGRHGSIYIGEFEELVKRNAFAPWMLNFFKTRWGRHNGAPADTCTLAYGNPWLGDLRNVPIPDIPENTVMARDGKHIKHRGWRTLLKFMCQDKWLKPTEEVRELLGTADFEEARKGYGCL